MAEILTTGGARANGGNSEDARQEAHVRALLEELDNCIRAGREERVAAIKAELGQTAAEATPPAERAQKRPAAPYRRTNR